MGPCGWNRSSSRSTQSKISSEALHNTLTDTATRERDLDASCPAEMHIYPMSLRTYHTSLVGFAAGCDDRVTEDLVEYGANEAIWRIVRRHHPIRVRHRVL